MAVKSPWASINDMLIQNKCWLCEVQFARGKSKKVFQVSELVHFFQQYSEVDISNAENMPTIVPFLSKNLRSCFECYVDLKNKSVGDEDFLLSTFQENDIQAWMSGLVCGQSPECKQELVYFIATKETEKNEPSNKAKTSALFSFANKTADGKDCPPGCGCDNPWPFLT